MTHEQGIDFEKVEALRRHMLLSKSDMASLAQVSRQTYYGWVRGKPMRKRKDEEFRGVLRKLLNIIKDHEWPMPEVLDLEQEGRMEKLLALYGEYE